MFFVFFKPKKKLPGVGVPYKCDQQGDDTVIYRGSKGMPDNWKARGAVCDGLYIPDGTNLQGQSTTNVLEWMGEINSTRGTPKQWKVITDLIASPSEENMKALAEAASFQASKN